jgi:hypothetical protein
MQRQGGPDELAAPASRPAVARPASEPLRTRRRPLLVGLGVALTALGGLGAAWLASSGTGTVSVVGVRHEIRAGAVIQREDLVSVQVATGSELHSVPVDRAESVIGKRSLVRVLPGSLLNPDGLADKLVPAAGQALVGLSLGTAQHPGLALDAGDPVEIVHTPGANDQVGQDGLSSPVQAVVVSTSDDPDTGRTIVDVTVPDDAAARVAGWSSASQASVVLLPAVRG